MATVDTALKEELKEAEAIKELQAQVVDCSRQLVDSFQSCTFYLQQQVAIKGPSCSPTPPLTPGGPVPLSFGMGAGLAASSKVNT